MNLASLMTVDRSSAQMGVHIFKEPIRVRNNETIILTPTIRIPLDADSDESIQVVDCGWRIVRSEV